MKIRIADVMATDLSALVDRVTEDWAVDFLTKPVGEQYKLCAYLARLFPGRLIVEGGTAEGTSAIAFASAGNPVVTCDPVDRRRWDFEGLSVDYRQCGINDPQIREASRSAAIVLLDADHFAVEERRFYNWLKSIDWRGLLVIDDICNPGSRHPMRRFWESIELPKHELTTWCHHSGTGLVDFGMNVEIEDPTR